MVSVVSVHPSDRAACAGFCGQLKTPAVRRLEQVGVAGTTITSCLRTWLQAEFASSVIDHGDSRDTLSSSTCKLI